MADPPAPDRPGSQGFELRRSEVREPMMTGEAPRPAQARSRARALPVLAAAVVVLLVVAGLVWLLAT